MISRYEVWLNDVPLSGIDTNIYVYDISYQAAGLARTTSRIAALDGQYSGGKDYIDSNKITVSFMVREYRTARRQEIVQNVIAWASNGGWLKTNDRTGKRIRVVPTRLPAVSSVMQWTDVLSLEFTAFDFPYWQDETAQTVTLAKGKSGKLTLPGVRRTQVEAVITANAAITTFTIVCGATKIVLAGLELAAGDVVNISYTDDHHILEIKSGNTSLLNKRTAASNDDLIAEVGENSVSFSASGSATCTLSAKGVYL